MQAEEDTPSPEASDGGRVSWDSFPEAPNLGGLSLRTETPPILKAPGSSHGLQTASSGTYKRSADSELESRALKRSPSCDPNNGPKYGHCSAAPRRRLLTRATVPAAPANDISGRGESSCGLSPAVALSKKQALDLITEQRDLGYGTIDCLGAQQSRRDDRIQPHKDAAHHQSSNVMCCDVDHGTRVNQGLEQSVTTLRAQPETIPISREQLAVEIKGIYAGLVMVEAKCVNIDNQKAANLYEELSPEQWQALIALHRTLLYEHHDFLMATQHPAATPALRGLATKYCMPARMWKHGIHAFLEVLRHRRPQSQEYMLSFIYLAYQMMALLLETVPGFTDTWTECLGDLARYRMAIEEDKDSHAAWGDVARSWYQMASDRHPAVGRLYHHLGILQRPSLCKLYYYSRSLTSVIPFYNATESLTTLCAPILKDDQALKNGSHSAEAMSICFHARVFAEQSAGESAGQSEQIIIRDGELALALLDKQPSIKIASYGVHLVVTSIAALLSFGAPENHYRQMFDQVLNHQIHVNHSDVPGPKNYVLGTFLDLSRSLRPLPFVTEFLYKAINTVVRRQPSRLDLQDLLPFVHISFAWLFALHTLLTRFQPNDPLLCTLTPLIDDSRLDWSAIAEFLNATAAIHPITSRIELFARQGMFPTGGKPLHEDYAIRGLVWGQWYFSPDWFAGMEDDDGSRLLDDAAKKIARAERAIWLGLRMARQHDCFLRYDESMKRFSAVSKISASTVMTETTLSSRASSTSPHVSTRSSLESDFVVVSHPPSPPSGLTYASVAAGAPSNGTSSRRPLNTTLAKPQAKREYSSSSKVSTRCSDSDVKMKPEEGMDVS
ncbi:hypothetical protein B0A48_18542 [Cryoendolithus antarcticus]|uniref:DNA/RNA-binding domain-containing protein n=1 Tax=Cryoendolithus antarcticus TaxID=1507870 RepID=A0A1V8S8M6_9PEZI|nr:hypothetical protein B0A48_18542 [Cryoendolithus antarcticus]